MSLTSAANRRITRLTSTLDDYTARICNPVNYPLANYWNSQLSSPVILEPINFSHFLFLICIGGGLTSAAPEENLSILHGRIAPRGSYKHQEEKYYAGIRGKEIWGIKNEQGTVLLFATFTLAAACYACQHCSLLIEIVNRVIARPKTGKSRLVKEQRRSCMKAG